MKYRRGQVKTDWLPIIIAGAVAVGLIWLFLVNIPKANAWTYGVSGSAVCEPAGWKVSWTVDNTAEDEPLHILTSDRASVPAPVDVPANDSSTFTETVVGNDPVVLNLTGNFDGDEQVRERSATVEFEGECVPEKPPVVIPPEVIGLPNTSIAD